MLAAANGIDRLITRICRFVVLVTGITLTALLTGNVVARYVLATGGLDAAEEIPERLFPWFIVAGITLAAQAGGHMSVDWLLDRLGPSGRRWLLQEVIQTQFEEMRTTVHEIAEMEWHSVLDPGLITVLLVKPEQMSAWNLYSYSQHLKENRQKALRYEIALWAKFVNPFAVVVMMVLALPFAHLQSRQAGIGAKIFTGIMLGLVFYLMNRLFSHLGLLSSWPPLATAVMPTAIFLSVAIALMWWQERR